MRHLSEKMGRCRKVRGDVEEEAGVGSGPNKLVIVNISQLTGSTLPNPWTHITGGGALSGFAAFPRSKEINVRAAREPASQEWKNTFGGNQNTAPPTPSAKPTH